MNLPKFIIVKKETTTEAVCDACNRAIKHTFVVKNTKMEPIVHLEVDVLRKLQNKR